MRIDCAEGLPHVVQPHKVIIRETRAKLRDSMVLETNEDV